jgi:hypothetical protein
MPDSILNTPAEVKAALKAAPERAKITRVLMASPEHFSVETAINPWMKTKSGRLNKVSPKAAIAQWEALKGAYEKIGIGVEVIEAGGKLPDFCFCANQSFPFLDGHSRPAVILSRMKNESRAPEVPYYERWYSASAAGASMSCPNRCRASRAWATPFATPASALSSAALARAARKTPGPRSRRYRTCP